MIIVADGAKPGPEGGPRYVASDECWLGKIDHKDPNKIEWSKLPAHPGTARFGIAGGGSNNEHRIFFFGGTATPHDYKGVSYDGQPAEASTVTFDYDLHHNKWETISDTTSEARLDGSGIVETSVRSRGPRRHGRESRRNFESNFAAEKTMTEKMTRSNNDSEIYDDSCIRVCAMQDNVNPR